MGFANVGCSLPFTFSYSLPVQDASICYPGFSIWGGRQPCHPIGQFFFNLQTDPKFTKLWKAKDQHPEKIKAEITVSGDLMLILRFYHSFWFSVYVSTLCRGPRLDQDFLRRARAEETRAEQRFRSTQRRGFNHGLHRDSHRYEVEIRS